MKTDREQGSAAGDEVLLAEGVRRLRPEQVKIFEGVSSMMHCAVAGEDVYRGVFAVRMFPVRYPGRFISLHYTDVHDKDIEIGVIEDPAAFPEDQQELLFRSLHAHYYERVIRRVYDVQSEFGMLFFDVETQQGREQFVMPWRGDRAEDYGDDGKVLLDALDNRYIIPRVSDLPTADRRRFSSYIYW
jgi:ATP-binding cassette, subfamily B, bacterial